MTVNLLMMENTVRRMTARYTEAQMTTAQIDNYINLAYTLHFPESFKNTKLTKPYVFLTTPNVDTYPFVYQSGLQTTPAGVPVPGNIQVTPPVYCQGYLLRYFQDKTTFYNLWPKLSVNQQVGVGGLDDGIAYTGTIPSCPFYRAETDIFGNVTEAGVIISAIDPNTQSSQNPFVFTATDRPIAGSNTGDLVDINGNDVGDVDYITGGFNFTPNGTDTIPAGNVIYASVVPYQSSRPVDVLFYNQQIIMRPCPQQVYQVEFQISQQPTELIGANAMPELNEWYLFICAWAAKLIYTDFPDDQGMSYLMPIWQEQMQMAQRRTLRQLSSQRAATIFSDPGWSRNSASYFYGTAYSGN
jgi:hypothetical protein